MGGDVGAFFDRSAEQYRRTPAGMAPYHRVTAARLAAELQGRVLALGGVWAQPSGDLGALDLLVADLSIGMLEGYRAAARWLVACDALHASFAVSSFDHVVLPLVLHHVAGRSACEARANVRRALAEVRGLLHPGGTLWISEFCTSPPVYAAQRLLAPLTRRILGWVREPLVVMHSRAFYRQVLLDQDWRDVAITRVRAPDARPTDWVRPVIAVPALRVPRFLYPLHPTLIRAVA